MNGCAICGTGYIDGCPNCALRQRTMIFWCLVTVVVVVGVLFALQGLQTARRNGVRAETERETGMTYDDYKELTGGYWGF